MVLQLFDDQLTVVNEKRICQMQDIPSVYDTSNWLDNSVTHKDKQSAAGEQ